MTLRRIREVGAEQLHFVLLSRLFALKTHLDEAKASAPLRLPIPHNDGINHRARLLEVIDQDFLKVHHHP